MLEILIELPPSFQKWIIEYIQALMLSLDNTLAIAIDAVDNDQDLALAWADSLINDLQSDNQNLINLITHPSFGQAPITITISESEPILRACASLRLKIQQHLLANINDQMLEEGEINPNDLSEKELHAYQCYIFLAALQIAILEALNPNLKNISL
jgi:hypothetical protein